MKSKRNVLILKGDLSAGDVLNLLDRLLKEVGLQNLQEQAPEPWELFSLICASGAVSPLAILLGPGKKTIKKCRHFLQAIEKYSSLSDVPSSYKAWENMSSVWKDMAKLDSGTSLLLLKDRSDAFIWNFHRDDEDPKPVTSYNYPKTTEPRDVTVLELLYESLCVQEYPHVEDPEREPKYPFNGLLDHTQIAQELHDGYIVSMRPRAKDSEELNAELAHLKDRKFGNHYPFIFHDLHTNDAHQPMLKAAAEILADWQAGILRETGDESPDEKEDKL